MASEHLNDVPITIIGAGQSGLATGYYLQEFGLDFAILADDERVGDTWRNRWDSLQLYTPAFYNDLPGMEFPADDPDHLPGKDEVADYLERYADEFDLPVNLETRVTQVRHEDGDYLLETTDTTVRTDHVVVATGAYSHPNIPEIAEEISDSIVTCHSSEYTNPSDLQAGDILVVGAANSGTQIATELANATEHAQVWLVGPDTGTVPREILGLDFYRWAGPTVLRLKRDGILGSRLHEKTAGHTDPVFDTERDKMQAAGVNSVEGRISGVENGLPVTADGQQFDVSNIIWCTGFKPDYSWIDIDVFQENGYPRHSRGVVTEMPGLYFVGLPWQYRSSSSLLGGVGPDAKHIATEIRDHVQETNSISPH